MRTELYGKEEFYSMWNDLYNESLLGMNIGGNCDVCESGEYELVSYLSDKLKGGVVFDVGANVGEYSLMLADMLEGTKIYAFEPSPTAYSMLEKNVGDYSGIVVNNIGLSDEEGTGIMYSNEEGSVFGSLYKRNLEHIGILFESKEEVQIDTLDNYCSHNKITNIDFLKLDVEGNELKVLNGARDMIKKGRIQRIQFEFGGCNIDSRTFFRDFWLLLSKDFEIYRILKDGLWQITKYNERLEIFTYTNYFCNYKGITL